MTTRKVVARILAGFAIASLGCTPAALLGFGPYITLAFLGGFLVLAAAAACFDPNI